MGYREYFSKINKNFTKDCNNVKSEKEYYSLIKKYYPKQADKNIQFYDFQDVVFEFGKNFEFSRELQKISKQLFPNCETLQSDCEPYIVNEDGLKAVIKEYENYIINYYKKLIQYIENDKNPKETKLVKAYNCITDNFSNIYSEYFDIGFVNLNKDDSKLTNSWLYEHAIFNLVYIYKTFDWKNYDLIFYGW